ncbi:haloacid dehalogenase [Podospora appendiculata]|uniref:Haloacid dehalogenase n=1 Tax=Podospora appendiculata TaxID=314037 RepID=A0AAE1CAF9_9PEZI|nr:haloacid dehalogenase [Podospora appendiculata]
MSTPLADQIEALTFDVFGTCVDWRSSITTALTTAASAKLASPSFASLAPETQTRLRSLAPSDWAAFAQEWRASYGQFTRSFVPGTTPWKDIDTHHHDSLVALLDEWRLAGVYSPSELHELSRAWHFLAPWPDTAAGLRRLGSRFTVAALSNGNQALLADLDRHGGLGFHRLTSAEDFKAYKPDPATYLGACVALGLEPGRVAMVAAHLGDLAAARRNGLRTVYVERSREEEWRVDEERYAEARGWVDLWVEEGQGGFLEVARRLGVGE